MVVDLKVHVRVLIAKASRVPTSDPAKVFPWVRDKYVFTRESFAKVGYYESP